MDVSQSLSQPENALPDIATPFLPMMRVGVRPVVVKLGGQGPSALLPQSRSIGNDIFLGRLFVSLAQAYDAIRNHDGKIRYVRQGLGTNATHKTICCVSLTCAFHVKLTETAKGLWEVASCTLDHLETCTAPVHLRMEDVVNIPEVQAAVLEKNTSQERICDVIRLCTGFVADTSFISHLTKLVTAAVDEQSRNDYFLVENLLEHLANQGSEFYAVLELERKGPQGQIINSTRRFGRANDLVRAHPDFAHTTFEPPPQQATSSIPSGASATSNFFSSVTIR